MEPEVLDWLENLPDEQFGVAEFYIELLAGQGPLLGEPYPRQLDGEVQRARRAMRWCIAQQHTPDEDDGSGTDG
ncbi:hypothetical protein [Kutzneria chonburiensis]|uniref:Uncharacterized protein n=1 Tax=Kutzneria chonburiensis TaxID=1483604 RepID=A0ABV6MWE0_9PSEU|nr:hypothetical protein [Kutzneria chonburiensis]